jgi:hypothetical protein
VTPYVGLGIAIGLWVALIAAVVIALIAGHR